jgi:hypothetical protein
MIMCKELGQSGKSNTRFKCEANTRLKWETKPLVKFGNQPERGKHLNTWYYKGGTVCFPIVYIF